MVVCAWMLKFCGLLALASSPAGLSSFVLSDAPSCLTASAGRSALIPTNCGGGPKSPAAAHRSPMRTIAGKIKIDLPGRGLGIALGWANIRRPRHGISKGEFGQFGLHV